MAIYRGPGGAGDSTDDATISAVAVYASNAAASAEAAATSETNAASSASGASTSAVNAATSESNAATYAANAASNASSAATQVGLATTAATNAATSATAASVSAGVASSAESNALGYRNSAESYAAAAELAAEDADDAATIASEAAADTLALFGSAEDVTNAVAAAATSATNSATSADEAAASAASAASSVTNVADAIDTATTNVTNLIIGYVDEAAAYVDEASDYATNAAASAAAAELSSIYANLYEDGANSAASFANTRATASEASATAAEASATAAASSATTAQTSADTAAAITGSGNGTFVNTPITTNSSVTLSAGTANGVAYLNGSKAITTGSALTFDGTNLFTVAAATPKIRVSDNGLAADFGLDFYFPSVASSYGQVTLNGATGGMRFVAGKAGSTGYYQAFELNGSEQMRLTSTGLGIGTSSPDEVLTVLGNIHADGSGSGSGTFGPFVEIGRSNGPRLQATQEGADNDIQGLAFFTKNSSVTGDNPTERMRLDSSGNLGIGTSSPASDSRFHIFGADTLNKYIRIENSNGTSYFGTISDGTAVVESNTAIKFTTGGSYTERLRIDSSGNVGIGTSSPAKQLQIESSTGGTLRFSSSDASVGAGESIGEIDWYSKDLSSSGMGVRAFINVVENDSGSGRAYDMTFGTGNVATATEKMRLTKEGNVGIGTSSPSSKLTVEGTFAVGNGVSGAINYGATGALTLGSTAAEALILRTNSAERARIDSSGNLIQTVNTTAATLANNNTLTFSIVDNSTLRISVRGSDGTTRTATVALT